MNDSTPSLITEDEFNVSVKNWTVLTRKRAKSNIPSGNEKEWKGRKTKKLAQSITYRFSKSFGVVSRIRYSFERHGVFLHYGVGRGYIRSGNEVIRGKRSGKDKIATNGSINRTPVNWFDVEIKRGIKQLAEVVQEFYGDSALKDILEKMDKFTIGK